MDWLVGSSNLIDDILSVCSGNYIKNYISSTHLLLYTNSLPYRAQIDIFIQDKKENTTQTWELSDVSAATFQRAKQRQQLRVYSTLYSVDYILQAQPWLDILVRLGINANDKTRLQLLCYQESTRLGFAEMSKICGFLMFGCCEWGCASEGRVRMNDYAKPMNHVSDHYPRIFK
jgi:hypothetical protein